MIIISKHLQIIKLIIIITVKYALCFHVCITLPRPVAGEPAQLKCKCSGSHQIRLGEKLSSDIQVSVQDSIGNEIKKVGSYVT